MDALSSPSRIRVVSIERFSGRPRDTARPVPATWPVSDGPRKVICGLSYPLHSNVSIRPLDVQKGSACQESIAVLRSLHTGLRKLHWYMAHRNESLMVQVDFGGKHGLEADGNRTTMTIQWFRDAASGKCRIWQRSCSGIYGSGFLDDMNPARHCSRIECNAGRTD